MEIMSKSLTSQNILYEHHVVNQVACPMCQNDNETYEHLFLKCDFARVIWFGMLMDVRRSEFDIQDLPQ